MKYKIKIPTSAREAINLSKKIQTMRKFLNKTQNSFIVFLDIWQDQKCDPSCCKKFDGKLD